MLELKNLLITDSDKILVLKNSLQELFFKVYGRPLSDKEFNHLYLNCPLGSAKLSVIFQDEKLVASVAIIPQMLVLSNGQKISYYLQSGMMIDESVRGIATFNKLMSVIHSYIDTIESFVIAFPNEKSFLPLTKFCGWGHIYDYEIEVYECCNLDSTNSPNTKLRSIDWKYKFDADLLQWRGELNQLVIIKEGHSVVIFKNYNGAMEILDVEGSEVPVHLLASKLGFKVINIPSCFKDKLKFEGIIKKGTIGNLQRLTIYPKNRNEIEYKLIKPSLLLSDVF